VDNVETSKVLFIFPPFSLFVQNVGTFSSSNIYPQTTCVILWHQIISSHKSLTTFNILTCPNSNRIWYFWWHSGFPKTIWKFRILLIITFAIIRIHSLVRRIIFCIDIVVFTTSSFYFWLNIRVFAVHKAAPRYLYIFFLYGYVITRVVFDVGFCPNAFQK